jgi:hypothetical protein
MEEVPENGKKLSHFAHAKGMNEIIILFIGFSAWCFHKLFLCVQ